MLDELEFAIHFQWTSMHNNTSYTVIRVKYDADGNLFMTLINGDLLTLYVGHAKWFEFTTLAHSKNFTNPNSHGIRGIINSPKLKMKLKKVFKDLE